MDLTLKVVDAFGDHLLVLADGGFGGAGGRPGLGCRDAVHLGPTPIRHVAQRRQHVLAVATRGLVQWRERQLDADLFAASGHGRHLEWLVGTDQRSLSRAAVQRQPLLMKADEGGRDQDLDGSADGLAGCPAKQALGSRIPQDDAPGLQVADDDRVAGVDEEWTQPEVTRAETAMVLG